MTEYHVSPSQQVSYIYGCPRLWAFEYIWGQKTAGTDATARGLAIHKILEDYTLAGKMPDLSTKYGQIAQRALRYIPAPGTPGVVAEKRIELISPRGNKFVFLKDLALPGVPVSRIWDYKSTSNLDFAHTQEELETTDPQGVTYAAHEFLSEKAVEQVDEQWLYLLCAAQPHCHPVNAVHRRDTCLARFDKLDLIAGHMLAHRREKTHPMAFEPNAKQCHAFNRVCPHKGVDCHLTELEEMIAAMSGAHTQDFLKAIERNVGSPGPTPGAQPLIASAAAATPLPTPPPPPFLSPGGGPAPVAAPPAPVFVPPAPQAPAIVAAPKLPWMTQAPAPVQPQPTPVQPQTAPEPVADVPPAVEIVEPLAPEPAPKRKRRTKAEMEAARAAALAGGQTEAEAIAEAEVVEPEEEPAEEISPQEHKAQIVAAPGIQRPKDAMLAGTFLQISTAMAQNPGYCCLTSTEFAARARALASAVCEEVRDL